MRMNFTKRLPWLGLVAALAWASPAAAQSPAQGTAPDDCGAGALAALIGKPVSALEGLHGAGPVRLIRPGQFVTMDHIPARLNVHLDAADLITGLTCG
jgi:hypothetical protein